MPQLSSSMAVMTPPCSTPVLTSPTGGTRLTDGAVTLTFQAATAFIDSTGYCLFIAFPILDIAKGWEGMAESVAGVTGQNITGADVLAIGKEVLKMERLFNERAGFTAEDDRPPEFMREEILPGMSDMAERSSRSYAVLLARGLQGLVVVPQFFLKIVAVVLVGCCPANPRSPVVVAFLVEYVCG